MGETLISLYFSGNLLQYLQLLSFIVGVGEKEEILSENKPADKVQRVLSLFSEAKKKQNLRVLGIICCLLSSL